MNSTYTSRNYDRRFLGRLLALIGLTSGSILPACSDSRTTPFVKYRAKTFIEELGQLTVLALVAGMLLALPQPIHAAAGDLDPTFGVGGKVTTSFPGSEDRAYAIAIQSDGKKVVAGLSNDLFILVRYANNGSLDTSFGNGGLVITEFSSYQDGASAIALQSDGKILAAGFAAASPGTDFAVARYNTDGSLDVTFGSGGKVTTDFFHSYDEARALALQADGRIVVVGYALNGTAQDFALARYNSDGSLDATFGNGGKVVTDFFGARDDARGVAIQADGKIVVTGFAYSGSTNYDFALARYNTDGTPDTSFGTLGKTTTDFFNGDDEANAIAIQPDGKIVLAGSIDDGSNPGYPNFGLARYNSNGSLDTTFGSGGLINTNFSQQSDAANAVIVLSNGKIIAAGHADGVGQEFALVSYNPDGSLDSTFGNGGSVKTDFSGGYDSANALAVEPDGKIIAAGTAGFSPPGPEVRVDNIGLARYNPDGSLDSAFGSGGKVSTELNQGWGGAGDAVIQPDGKIVAVGYFNVGGVIPPGNRTDFALARYLSDGSLDPTFGNRGVVTTDLFGKEEGAAALALQQNGRIVVAGDVDNTGTTSGDFAVVRYLSNGSLDATFGSGGKVTTDFSNGLDQALDVAIQLDGKILVAGYAQGSTASDFALARYNADGTLDSTFGNGGKVTSDFSGRDNQANAMAIQADGKIILAGYDGSGLARDFALARYDQNGALDTTFGNGGVVVTDFNGEDDMARAIAIQTDGRIIAAGGSTVSSGGNDIKLARYMSSGSLDSSFGNGGRVITGIAYDEARSVALQADGKIVVGAEVVEHVVTTHYDFGLLRFDSNGTLDTTFGNCGVVLTDFDFFAGNELVAVMIQSDGQIVAAGSARRQGPRFALARYEGGPLTAPGVCGCGVADTDTDHDGTPDCHDACPNDPNKIAPGICGCGVADTDTDHDGTPDCHDACPNDPNKIAPGICGCGVADTDTDHDGTPDCHDACPNDPNKTAPGVCGCGVADTDIDHDGTPDCHDACPSDPHKIAPGVCGCGVPDTDSDGDGIPNCHDNCPNTFNPDQRDTDHDGIGDECDATPGNTCGQVDGEGSLSTNSRASFDVDVKFKRSEGPKGQVNYRDKAANLTLVSTKITSLIIYGTHATIRGVGKVNRVTVNFRVDVDDHGSTDSFRIQWPSYTATGMVRGAEGVKIKRDDCKGDDDDRDDRDRDKGHELLSLILSPRFSWGLRHVS